VVSIDSKDPQLQWALQDLGTELPMLPPCKTASWLLFSCLLLQRYQCGGPQSCRVLAAFSRVLWALGQGCYRTWAGPSLSS